MKAALDNPARRIRRLFATENAARRLAEDGVALPLEPELVRPGRDRTAAGARRRAPGAAGRSRSPALARARRHRPAGIVLVLDQITDPHNVGAILRTAAAFARRGGGHHRAPQPGSDRRAGEVGLRRAGIRADRDGAEPRARDGGAAASAASCSSGSTAAATPTSATCALRAPLALVLGAEGKGLRQLTRATCDRVARLDLPGPIKSLNVSNAAALALYVATKRAP